MWKCRPTMALTQRLVWYSGKIFIPTVCRLHNTHWALATMHLI